jgi:hypothetical protein
MELVEKVQFVIVLFSLHFASMNLQLKMKFDRPQKKLVLGTTIQKFQGCIGLRNHQNPQTLEQCYIYKTWFNGCKKIYSMNNAMVVDH